MIIEQLPEVQRLTESEKFQLATELWDQLSTSLKPAPDPRIVRLLEQRYAEFETGNHPSRPWAEIKRHIGK